MQIIKRLSTTMLALLLAIPAIASAAVVYPALEIQKGSGDAGAAFSNSFTQLDIDATVFQIVTDTTPVDIPNQSFTLTSSYDGNTGWFTGSFSVGGGLLDGTFSNLAVSELGGTFYFEADLSYTSGSLMSPGITSGRINGSWTGSTLSAKLGQVTVVPVPAAAWLFGSGLLGLVAVARRRT